MPKEVIHWGESYSVVKVPNTQDQAGYEYRLGREEAAKAIQVGQVQARNVTNSYTPGLSVHWTRDRQSSPSRLDDERPGTVQVAVYLSDYEFRQRISAFEGNPTDEANLTIITNPLSRRELNKMIRTLKRARDAALGADE